MLKHTTLHIYSVSFNRMLFVVVAVFFFVAQAKEIPKRHTHARRRRSGGGRSWRWKKAFKCTESSTRRLMYCVCVKNILMEQVNNFVPIERGREQERWYPYIKRLTMWRTFADVIRSVWVWERECTHVCMSMCELCATVHGYKEHCSEFHILFSFFVVVIIVVAIRSNVYHDNGFQSFLFLWRFCLVLFFYIFLRYIFLIFLLSMQMNTLCVPLPTASDYIYRVCVHLKCTFYQ